MHVVVGKVMFQIGALLKFRNYAGRSGIKAMQMFYHIIVDFQMYRKIHQTIWLFQHIQMCYCPCKHRDILDESRVI